MFSGRLWTIFGTALALILIANCAPAGMRLLRMEIYQSDQLVLRTNFDAPDREGPADFWQRAGFEPFASDEEAGTATSGKAFAPVAV